MAYNLPFQNGLGPVGCTGNSPQNCENALFSPGGMRTFSPFNNAQKSQLLSMARNGSNQARSQMAMNSTKEFKIPVVPPEWAGVI